MTIRIAVPVILARMQVIVDKGVHWSPIDWMLLWALHKNPSTPSLLAAEMNLPRHVVIEIIWKLMRFGWVEATADRENFSATNAGIRVLHIPDGLPTLEWLDQTIVRAVIEPSQGRVYPSSEVVVIHKSRLQLLEKEFDIRRLNYGRFVQPNIEELEYAAQACLKNPYEDFVRINTDRSKADLRYIIVNVFEGECQGLPKNAPQLLVNDIRKAARIKKKGTIKFKKQIQNPLPKVVDNISIDEQDILLEGSVHLEKVREILRLSSHRIIIHSTFLSLKGFQNLQEDIRVAVRKGARIDILYGADANEKTREKNFSVASKISKLIAEDRVLKHSVVMHMISTKSHAKLIIADQGRSDEFIAIVGSCNWLSSPYSRVETSILLRDNRVIAHILKEICEMIFAVSCTSSLVADLQDISLGIRQKTGPVGEASVSLIIGNSHDGLIRKARDEAYSSIDVGGDFFGQAGEAKTVIPLMSAGKNGVRSKIWYSRPKLPVTDEDLSDLSFLAEEKRVELSQVDEGVLHGKFLAWDDSDVVISSLNWSSAGTKADNPWREIGIHIHMPGIGIKFKKLIKTSLENAKLAQLTKKSRKSKRKRRNQR